MNKNKDRSDRVRRLAKQRGWTIEHDREASSGSHYFLISHGGGDPVSVRIADHPQPVSVNIRGKETVVGGLDLETGNRHDAADVSIDSDATLESIERQLGEALGVEMAGSLRTKRHSQAADAAVFDDEVSDYERRGVQNPGGGTMSRDEIVAHLRMVYGLTGSSMDKRLSLEARERNRAIRRHLARLAKGGAS